MSKKFNNRNPRRMVPKEFLGAFKQGHRMNVREFIDDELAWELLSKLESNPEDTESRKALEFLTKYNNEAYKGFLKKGDPDAIHKCECEGKKHNPGCLYKEASDAHNARKRDLTTKERDFMKSIDQGMKLDNVDDTVDNQKFLNETRDLNHEDHVIALIDANYGIEDED